MEGLTGIRGAGKSTRSCLPTKHIPIIIQQQQQIGMHMCHYKRLALKKFLDLNADHEMTLHNMTYPPFIPQITTQSKAETFKALSM